MYRSIRIRRFRCFRDITLDKLLPVNLIAGHNNAGKTALLEAILLHCGATDPELVLRINVSRGMRIQHADTTKGQAPWDCIFHNLDCSNPVEISGVDVDGKSRWLKLISLSKGFSTGDIGDRNGTGEPAYSHIASSKPRGLALRLEYGSEESTGQVDLELRGNKTYMAHVDDSAPPPLPAIFIASHWRGEGNDVVERFSKLSIERRAQPVVDVARLLEPRLRDLSVNVQSGSPVLWADVGLPELLPIQYLGDGIGRALSLAAGIATFPDGIVLVDEVDAGLHHSAFYRLWKAIVELATKLNVQLFATTHSHECLVAARKVAQEFAFPVLRFHRLDRIDDNVEAVTYDDEGLDAAIAADLEVR
ncbi:MAG: AAA family ATPase [Phycisphaerae bacterium]|nr:AAA family ATPase [Phycisphaerae bacterium]